jgi:hypothetical protein
VIESIKKCRNWYINDPLYTDETIFRVLSTSFWIKQKKQLFINLCNGCAVLCNDCALLLQTMVLFHVTVVLFHVTIVLFSLAGGT